MPFSYRHILVISLFAAAGMLMDAVASGQQSPQRRRGSRAASGVYKADIEPHWFAGNSRFWYRNQLRDGQREFVLVDAASGTRQAAFDHGRLASALSAAIGDDQQSFEATRLPFDEIEFDDQLTQVRFIVEDQHWQCTLDDYTCEPYRPQEEAAEDADRENREGEDGNRRSGRRRRGGSRRSSQDMTSPDGKWQAMIREGNVFIEPREVDADENDENDSDNNNNDGGDGDDNNNDDDENQDTKGDPIPLSDDGTEQVSYQLLDWSPDSHALVAMRVEPGERKEVYLIESSPRGGGRAVLHSRPYALPGDRFTTYELSVFDIQQKQQHKPDLDKLEMEWGRPRIHWMRDGRHFGIQQVDRGHQRLRITAVDAHTGDTTPILDEQTETFIWTAHTENLDLQLVNWLTESDEIIYVSERDGWRHMYLVDATDGGIKHQITRGEYVLRGIDRIDEQQRQIWFHASGKNSDQDPYFIHYYRVDFDGKNLVALTEGNGTHSIQYSPDRQYLIDTYSRVDQAPIHRLRRVEDGQLVCDLEEADISELCERGWRPLEPFVAKGRDGTTDIWGVICRPRDFDPEKSYPVIENIYAGPQGSFVPKSFRSGNNYQALADLGFIVVQIDGMGTANRSKAFHDVCWHNLKDAGFPDRKRWIRAAAEKYPYMDLSRVGIYGGSAGGQNAAAAALFHPDFYHVAVAGCGCHDNRMDKASWNEQWMGYPVGPQYSECSNIDNAHRLEGQLLLIVGELDNNVPPESTMRFVDALVRADKDFEMLVVPGAGHGMGGRYGVRRMHEFFVRHLRPESQNNNNNNLE